MSTQLRKGSTCPTCQKAKLVPIVFGLPAMDLAALEGRGEVVLGGCVVSEPSPELQCRGCGAQFFRRGVPMLFHE